MAHSNGMITAPVSIHDVMSVVPVTLRATINGTTVTISSNDLGVLCSKKTGDTITGSYTDPNTGTVTQNVTWTVVRTDINIWAKYKPVDNTALHYMGQWDLTAATPTWKSPSDVGFTPSTPWWRGRGSSWKYGLEPFTSSSLSGIIQQYDLGDDMNGWTYHGPTGGIYSPYRLTDFASYNHRAQGLAEKFMVSNPLVVDSNKMATFIAAIMYSLDDGTNITPENILGDGSWYFGVAMVLNGSVAFSMSSRYEHTNNIEQAISLSGISENTTYTCYPFFSINPVSAGGSNTFYTIPLLHPVQTVVRNRTSQFQVNVGAEYGAQGTDRVRVVITIAVDANANYTDCYIELDNGGLELVNVTLSSWSASNTATGNATRYGKIKTSYFDLSPGITYTITITGLDVNSNYLGTLYATHAMYERRFGIMEVIQE